MDLEVELKHAGVVPAAIATHVAKLRGALHDLDRSPAGEFLRVLRRPELLKEIRTLRRKLPSRVRDVVQLGIGGSSLGAQALCAALLPPGHNRAPRAGAPRFFLPDNLDPDHFGALLEQLDPRRTLVHVVSKSGETLETQAQLHALLEFFRRHKRPLSRRNLIVTTGSRGPLRELAEVEGLTVLSVPDEVPGRYSVFTASGLLVPALCGVPVARVLAGARRMEDLCRADDGLGPAGRLAALHFIHDRERGRPIHVELIYADSLRLLGEWFRQIWAESLGKQGRGPTPVIARGSTDQHSQIQLYMEGPDDKLYTLLRVERFRTKLRIARRGVPEAIRGREMAEIFDAEARGTQRALVAGGRPLIEIRLARITPEAVGALLLLQQLQTALAGAFYGVDPFTQPGVEGGKRAVLSILGESASS